jgi:hypothetical protein
MSVCLYVFTDDAGARLFGTQWAERFARRGVARTYWGGQGPAESARGLGSTVPPMNFTGWIMISQGSSGFGLGKKKLSLLGMTAINLRAFDFVCCDIRQVTQGGKPTSKTQWLLATPLSPRPAICEVLLAAQSFEEEVDRRDRCDVSGGFPCGWENYGTCRRKHISLVVRSVVS